MDKNEIVIFETEDKMITIPVAVGNETVWLNRNQMAELFDRDVKTIGKHINNALKEELEDQVVVAKFATTTQHGAIEGKTQTHMTEYYNLDVIISVGYHVKSKRGFICGWGKENRRRCFSGADNYDCGIQTGGKGNDDQCDYELHAIRGKSENIAPNDTYLFTTGSK